MFSGQGDSSRLTDEEKRTLDHLRRLVETGHLVNLTPQQSLLAIRALEFYSRWEAVLSLGRSVRNTGILIGGLLALWWATQEGFADLVRRAVGID